ncbi:alpha/beta fold hydrolase [Crossiella cryophila]|uniref:Pimeloyl-ACP methyl ester carboxylesterase n=1 Tax=Crossiella cryophila TaxID=43355 RepID=A0A7W7C686_9PSEU|nr:alpha/beta fold hydrolase [Crossiella cryophila]MBB4675299.1 pimeloyl-ACP methyl ester carboxylesterase [Crossiella cryophila]
MKRLLRGSVAAALLLSALTVPTASATPLISWKPCAEAQLAAAGAECTDIAVPLDHANPGGPRISLAVSRVKHSVPESAYLGVLLVAPDAFTGGGYLFPLTAARLPGAGAAYDWVGFARRGLAPSSPALSCVPNYHDFNRPKYVPTSAADEQVWLDRTRSYADACANQEAKALLPHMRAVDVAADMDYVRAALGRQTVSLFGQTHGSYQAQVYASRYPFRLGRMVLDSSVDPRRVWYGANNVDLAQPLQRNFLIWFDWLAEHADSYHLGRTRDEVKALWDSKIREVSEQPAGGAIGPSELLDFFLVPAYNQASWPVFGKALADWVRTGDAEPLKALFTQVMHRGNDNVYAALLAQICTDAQMPADFPGWRRDAQALHTFAPDTTWGNVWFNAPCLRWPVQASTQVNTGGPTRTLLVAETLDAESPFTGSLETRSRWPNSALLALPGGTSNGVTPNGNACVNAALNAFLLRGELPARQPGVRADAECAPNPRPVPFG